MWTWNNYGVLGSICTRVVFLGIVSCRSLVMLTVLYHGLKYEPVAIDACAAAGLDLINEW